MLQFELHSASGKLLGQFGFNKLQNERKLTLSPGMGMSTDKIFLLANSVPEYLKKCQNAIKCNLIVLYVFKTSWGQKTGTFNWDPWSYRRGISMICSKISWIWSELQWTVDSYYGINKYKINTLPFVKTQQTHSDEPQFNVEMSSEQNKQTR